MIDWTNTNFGPPYGQMMNTNEGLIDKSLQDRKSTRAAGDLNNILFEAYFQSYHIQVDHFISEVLDVLHKNTDAYFCDFILRK
jgi:hypothetical protein